MKMTSNSPLKIRSSYLWRLRVKRKPWSHLRLQMFDSKYWGYWLDESTCTHSIARVRHNGRVIIVEFLLDLPVAYIRGQLIQRHFIRHLSTHPHHRVSYRGSQRRTWAARLNEKHDMQAASFRDAARTIGGADSTSPRGISQQVYLNKTPPHTVKICTKCEPWGRAEGMDQS